MSDLVNVRGLSELQAFLDQVPVKVEKNIMRGALRAGMKVVLPAAQANIHPVSGLLAAGLKIGTNSKRGTVIAYIRAKGVHGFIARFLEFGTAAHFISGRLAKFLSFGGRLFRIVQHPGMRPRPFMRPALDAGAEAAVIAAAQYMKTRLATKQGLDTADIQIGDEA